MAASAPSTNLAPAPAKSDITQFLVRFRETGILAVLLLIAFVVTLRNPDFISRQNLMSILLDTPLNIVIAMGMTTIILSRNIDLSVGSTLGLCAIVVGFTFKSHPDMPIWFGLLMGMGLGAVLGVINGLLITWLRVPAIIATLGTMSIYRGLIFIVSGGNSVQNSDIPQGLLSLSQTSPIGIPYIILFALIVTGAMHYFLRFSRTGRSVYAIGSNPIAARLRGIPSDRIIFLTFVVTGALSGLAGVMATSRFGIVYPPSIGVGVELSVIAATIIGGTNILGGSGSVPGTLLGCLLLGVIQNAIVISHLSAFWQYAIYGAIILIAVGVDAWIRRRLERAAELKKGR